MTGYAIYTDGLTKAYGQTQAVNGLNLRVPRGSIYGFLGRNGAGKTTTIRTLMGLTKPTSGSVSILDMTWRQDGLAILAKTGYVAERKLLFEYMTGDDLLHFNRPFFPSYSTDLAAKYVRELQIPMNRQFKMLSLGDRTKLCLLMAMSQRAELLILDEPTAGLDAVAMDELWRLLIEDHAGEGRTIFLSSHILPEVEKIADWVGIIDHGKLVLEDDLEEIRSDYRRITALGNALPTSTSAQVIATRASGSSCEYYVSKGADHFLADLRSQGATVLDVSPLNLEQVFLQVVRKEDSCISGNSGATPVGTSTRA